MGHGDAELGHEEEKVLFIVPRIVVVEAAACGAMLLLLLREQHASASSVAALRGGFCVQRGRSFSRACWRTSNHRICFFFLLRHCLRVLILFHSPYFKFAF